jgi:FtsH-binding integral membrane protein
MASSMSGPAGSSSQPDWPAQAAQFIEQTVGKARSKTTTPALLIARAVVYGLLAAFLGLMVLVLLAIALVRFADVWLPGNVWQAHLVIGVLFLVVGALAWSKRRAPMEASS